VSVPLPAAVAAALVLAIGLALTATLASLPTTDRIAAPASVPTSLLDVAQPAQGLPGAAAPAVARAQDASLTEGPALPLRKPLI
jgi:hypothetical protein